jgi:thermitase
MLTARGYKRKGLQKADLAWSGLTATKVDVYRNSTKIATTANDGAMTDAIDQKGSGSYSYKVCAASTATCSNQASVTF